MVSRSQCGCSLNTTSTFINLTNPTRALDSPFAIEASTLLRAFMTPVASISRWLVLYVVEYLLNSRHSHRVRATLALNLFQLVIDVADRQSQRCQALGH